MILILKILKIKKISIVDKQNISKVKANRILRILDAIE